jgi:hypothetical protein
VQKAIKFIKHGKIFICCHDSSIDIASLFSAHNYCSIKPQSISKMQGPAAIMSWLSILLIVLLKILDHIWVSTCRLKREINEIHSLYSMITIDDK